MANERAELADGQALLLGLIAFGDLATRAGPL